MKKRILSFLLVLCMCLTLVPVTVLADDDVQQINDAAVQAITPGSDVSVLSVVPDTGAYRTYKFYSGETLLSEQIVKNGDTLLEPEVPAQDGKVFTGWDNKDVHFGTISGITATETITVNAQFKDGYHVYFKDNNGRIIVTKTGKTNDTISVADVNFPVGSDEAITGWYTDAGQKVESVIIETSDITLYAKVEKGYWLTFESNGGSYVAPAFYANGTPAAAPDEPTKSGYTFAGWYTDENLMTAANFGNITATTTLYAKWAEDTNTSYTVIHWLENADDDGYSYKASETKTGTTGGQTNATAKSYTGFTAQTITQKAIAGDGSTIVSVYYKRNEYSVKFYTNSSLLSASTEYTALRITAKYGANISAKWPTYNGSSTWATSNNGSKYQVNIDTMPLGGANFYGPQTGNGSETAYYYVEALPGETGTPGPGNLNYKLHHSDTSPGTGYHVTDEDKYPITGFTFKTFSANWTLGGYKYNNAKFYYTRNSYDLVFISGGKTVKTESVKYQASIAGYANYKHDTAPEGKDGYIFAGWYDNELGEGTAYVFNGKTMPANNITLYAKWVAPTYTVTVYDQDGKKLDEIIVSKGDTVTDWLSTQKNKITLDTGDSFLGWTINRGLPFNPGTKITTNYNLYAKVGNSTGYSVTYDANGGTGSVTDTEKYAKGAEATVKSNNGFTNGDKVFLSWNTAADGTGKTYYPNSTVEITGNVTLYAQWGDKASTVSVTYHSNFDTDQTKTVKDIANNGQITVAAYDNTLGLSAREGYTFAGWTTEANGSGTKFSAGDSARVDNGSNDLYAQWAPNTNTKYTVEFYYQDDDGSYPSTASKIDPRTGTTDTIVSVTDADKEAKEDGKYVYDTTAANVESGKVAADGSLVLKLYFKLNQADVTVNYYWNETTNKVATSKTLTAQTVGSVITTETAIAIEGYTALPNQTCNLTVGVDASKNVINFYYYKNVELTAVSDSKVYNGSEQTISGYTGAPEGVTFNGISASGSGTDVGEYDVTFDEGTVGKVDTTNKYIVTKATPGKLTIAKRDVTVTGESATKVYNGQTQEINGYTVDNLVKGHEMTGVIYSAKGKDPGKYDGSFTGRQIVIKDAAGNDVTENYNVKTVIGVLTITQPSRPTRPSTPTKDVTSVKTADGSQMTLWMSMMLASAAGIVFLGKKRKEEQ